MTQCTVTKNALKCLILVLILSHPSNFQCLSQSSVWFFLSTSGHATCFRFWEGRINNNKYNSNCYRSDPNVNKHKILVLYKQKARISRMLPSKMNSEIMCREQCKSTHQYLQQSAGTLTHCFNMADMIRTWDRNVAFHCLGSRDYINNKHTIVKNIWY